MLLNHLSFYNYANVSKLLIKVYLSCPTEIAGLRLVLSVVLSVLLSVNNQ